MPRYSLHQIIAASVLALSAQTTAFAESHGLTNEYNLKNDLLLVAASNQTAKDESSLISDAKSGEIYNTDGHGWVEPNGTISAYFPSKPEVLRASNSDVKVTRYFSVKDYSIGRAQFSITVNPAELRAGDNTDQKKYLGMLLKGILKGATNPIEETIKTGWASFGDGRPQVFYEYIFMESGMPILNRGFAIVDGKRSIVASTLCLDILEPKEIREITSFLGTVSLIRE